MLITKESVLNLVENIASLFFSTLKLPAITITLL